MSQYRIIDLHSNNLFVVITTFIVLLIFKVPITVFAEKVITPILCLIPDNSWMIGVYIIVVIVFYYIHTWKHLTNERHLISGRVICIALAITYILLIKNDFLWYGIRYLNCSYATLAFIAISISEVLIIFNKIHKKPYSYLSQTSPLLSDSPSDLDDYNRGPWIDNLVEKMLSTFANGQLKKNSFTILLSDCFGAGKTTALNKMIKAIEDKTDHTASVIRFRPWLCEDGEKMVKNYFNTLAQVFGGEGEISEMLRHYGKGLTSDSSNILVKILNALFSKESRSLEEQYKDISANLSKYDSLTIILVDDVDRLQAKELLDLLKLIRDTADFPNIIYVVAADKVALKSTLESRGIKETEFYLRKFFNLEVMFPADDNAKNRAIAAQLDKIITYYNLSEKQLGKGGRDNFITFVLSIDYIDEILNNHRDIVRFFNLLTLSMDLMVKEDTLGDIYMPDLVKLTMIQMLDFETYRMLRDHSSYIFDNAGHRLTLNEDAKKGIINKIENRRIQNMISKISEKDNYEEHVQTSEQNFPTSLRDTIELCRPATEDIVSSLISNMFSDTYRESYNSISFTSEYFKYFAGCYRKTQISDKEIAEILLSTDTDFRVNYRDILKDRNDSFIHKWESYARNDANDRIGNLKKIMIAIEEYARIPSYGMRDWEIEDSRAISFKDILLGLYIKREDDDYKLEKARLCEFFMKEENSLRLQIVLLKSFYSPNLDHPQFLFSRDDIKEFAEILSRRAEIRLKEDKNPFDSDTLYVIRAMNSLQLSLWEQVFEEYLNSVVNPKAWLYILVIPYKECFDWNYSFLKTIGIESDPLESSINAYIKNLPLDDSCADDVEKLLELSKYNKQYLRSLGLETSNSFLKHALDWYHNSRYH